jgi:hypothetical protein
MTRRPTAGTRRLKIKTSRGGEVSIIPKVSVNNSIHTTSSGWPDSSDHECVVAWIAHNDHSHDDDDEDAVIVWLLVPVVHFSGVADTTCDCINSNSNCNAPRTFTTTAVESLVQCMVATATASINTTAFHDQQQ